MNRHLLFVIQLMISVVSFAQEINLRVLFYDSTLTIKPYKKIHVNEKTALKEIQKIYTQLLSDGYLASSIDSIIKKENQLTAYLFTGNRYLFGKIKNGNVDDEALRFAGFREKIFTEKPLNNKQIKILCHKIVEYYENQGYPFAGVLLDSIRMEQNHLHAVLKVDKNRLFKIDSIIIKGNALISKSYLYNYIQVKPGDIYNESLLKNVSVRLKEIPFVQVTRVPEIIFTDSDCRLMLYMDRKKAGNINGVAGILPDNRTGKIVVTGDARLNLKNIFGKGENIDLNWRRLNNNMQDLKTNFAYPFIFNSSFGADFGLKLFKKDTTFLELTRSAGMQYFIKGGTYFKLFASFYNSTLLSPKMFANASTLPAFADVSNTLYGIGLKHERLDYRLNPRKGYALNVDVSTGYKKIQKNPAINDILYENIKLKTIQYNVIGFAEIFFPFFKKQAFRIFNQTGMILNENIFSNELMRIGGFRTLRGFDEESIFVSTYTIMSMEYRFLLDRNSVFYFFYDHAYYERKLNDAFAHDSPFGFGAGINFETKAGIFTLNYALGKQQANPLLIRAAKIHFGFSAFL